VRRYAAIDEHHNVISREAGDARTREGKERTEAEEKRPKWLDLRLALLMTLSVGTLFNVFYHLSSGTSGSDLSSEELRSGGMPMRRRSF
jgi:hypothetical protein